ncbi:MAG: hypothetical protein K2X39_03810, partial [Silvanigrellaceae bacterium]|nr:hypothetical protein [Silvanigrellaceae bacterium]
MRKKMSALVFLIISGFVPLMSLSAFAQNSSCKLSELEVFCEGIIVDNDLTHHHMEGVAGLYKKNKPHE